MLFDDEKHSFIIKGNLVPVSKMNSFNSGLGFEKNILYLHFVKRTLVLNGDMVAFHNRDNGISHTREFN